jgi:hypothetical protein
MAAIRNLSLKIDKLEGELSEVTLTYEITFSRPEQLIGATFMEKASLRGADLLLDDDLGLPLLSRPVRAQAEPIRRSITRKIRNELLDEDRDTLLGVQLLREDELYARVILTPFVARGASAESNLVPGDFGLSGRPRSGR